MTNQIKYIEEIKKIIEVVENHEISKIIEGSEILSKTILNKKKIFVFGASHAGILTLESFFRAGGLVTIHPIMPRELELSNRPITLTSSMEQLQGYGTILGEKANICKDDILIVHSVSGRNPVSIELAEYAKEHYANVIAITNVTYSKQVKSKAKSGMNLYEVADLVLDNHGCFGDAVLSVPNHDVKIGASSTVIGTLLLNALFTETIFRLVEENIDVLPVFYSANTDDGQAKNIKMLKYYENQIDYEF